MKKQLILIAFLSLFINSGYSQNLITNLNSYLVNSNQTTGLFFDNDINTPSQIVTTNKTDCGTGCHIKSGRIGTGSSFTFDFGLPKQISVISLQNLAPTTWAKTNTSTPRNIVSTPVRIQILSSSSELGPWSVLKDTAYTIHYANSINLRINNIKISQILRIQFLEAPNLLVGCCDNLSFPKYEVIPINLGEIMIYENNTPLITSTVTSPLIDGQCTQLTAAAEGETYLWNTGETTRSINVCNAGTYTVQVTNTSFTGNQDHTATIAVSTLGRQDNLPSPNGEVYAIQKRGNTVYYGGDFTAVGPNTGSSALINETTGNANTTFPRVDGTINTTIADGNGGWYIGGNFTKVGVYNIKNLAHIKADNSVDLNFIPEPNNTINSLAINGSYLYIGGAFTTVKTLSNNYIAKLDKTNGDPIFWNANANNTVRTLTLYQDQIIIGGDFTSIGGLTRNRLAAVDTTFVQASAWNPNPNASVYKVYIAGAKLYVGGDFTNISGVAKSRGAGFTLPAFNIDGYDFGANGTIFDFVLNNNVIYVGGNFTVIGGQSRKYLAGLNPLNAIANSFNPSPDATVRALSVLNGNIIVGGDFSNIGGVARSRIASLSTTGTANTWNPNIIGIKGSTFTVQSIATNGSNIYAVGNFYSVGASVRNNLAAIDAKTGLLLPWNPNINNIVRAIDADDNMVYIGGDFTTVNGTILKNRIAQINTQTGLPTAWNPNANGIVRTLKISGNNLYVGGDFTSIGGATRNRIAAISTVNGGAQSFDPNASANVNTLAISGDTLHIGGDFTTIGGQTRNRIASYKISSNTLLSSNPNANGSVNALAVLGDKLYIGGAFTTIGGINNNGFAEYSLSNSTISSLSLNSTSGIINALSAIDSSVYVGGSQTINNNGQPINNLSTVKTKSGLTGYWQPQPDDIIRTIFVASDKVYVGGKFKTIQNRLQPYFASIDIFNSSSAPVISSLSKSNVCSGDSIKIYGSNFIDIFEAKVGNVPLNFRVNSSTELTIYLDALISGQITIKNALGNATSSTTITVNTLPTVSVNNAAICAGDPAATFTATTNASSPNYAWSGNGTGTAFTTIGTTAGNYTVTVTSNNGCKNSATGVLTVNTLPTVSVNNATICVGDPATTFTTTTNANSPTYVWSENGTGTSATTTGTTAGNYTVTVTSNNGCKNTATGVLTVNALPTVSVNNATICAGDPAATFTVSTNASSYTSVWSGNGTGSATTTTGTSAGNYTVTVTSNNGCKNTATGVLTVNALPTVSVNNAEICAGAPAATFTATTNASSPTYVWSENGTGTTATTTGTAAGNYTVTVTSSNGCKKTASGLLTVNALPTVSVNNAAICAGAAAATFTATTNAIAPTYVWSGNGTGTTSTTKGITAGNYTVTVTSNNGCKNTASGSLTVNDLPTVSVNNAAICAGDPAATFTATTDASSPTFVWSGNGTGTASTTTGTTAGNYTVTVTSNNGCKKTALGVLTVNALPTVSVNNAAICAGATAATFTATTNAISPTYVWSGNGTGTSSTTTGTTAGIYTVTVTSNNGCKKTASGLLTVNAIPSSQVTVSGNTLTATETGATYQWIDCNSTSNISGATNQTYNVTAFGSFKVTITKNGCSVTSICKDFAVTSLEDETLIENANQIYPNPSDGNFVIVSRENANATILNLQGVSVSNLGLQKGLNEINLSLPSGLYFIYINNQVSKLIIK